MDVRRKIPGLGAAQQANTTAQTTNEVAAPGAESSISVAVKAFRDGFLDHAEQADIAGRAANETDGATKAFLDTVSGYGADRIKAEQTASTQKHSGKLLTRARTMLGMDPKDPVLGGATVHLSALDAGLVKAWVKTTYDVDQPAARAKFETLLGAGQFYDAAVAGANLQHRAPALLALAIAAKSPDEAGAASSLLHAGRTLTEEARQEISLALIKNPATGATRAVAAAEYASHDDGSLESAVHKTGLYEALVRTHPNDEEVCDAGLSQLREMVVWLEHAPAAITSFAASLLETGASMRDILNALEPDSNYDRSQQTDEQVDRLIATLLTDVVAKSPAGLDDAKAVFNAPRFYPWGPASDAAAVKLGIVAPPPAKVPPEPTTW